MKVIEVTNKNQYEDALAVRHEVFVGEQNVPEDLEIDEHEDDSIHFVAYNHEQPVGAGRLRPVDNKGKVERICVIKSHRGKQMGAAIMEKVENTAREKGLDILVLNAQTHATDFYRNLGYEVTSDHEFMDAGIPHLEMRKPILATQ